MTNFLYDTGHIQLLRKRIIPALLTLRKVDMPLRIWIAGCGTGESAYMIAMMLLEQLQRTSGKTPVQIFATDPDAAALTTARTGSYSASAVAGLNRQLLQRFFTATGQDYRVIPALRDIIIFARHDLLSDPPFSRLDLISLPVAPVSAVQEKTLKCCHFALNPGGTLLLTDSKKFIDDQQLFEPVAGQPHWYRRLNTSSDEAGMEPAPWSGDGGLQPCYHQEILCENEEYRLICEELRCYKEELQSLNEELLSANQQLQSRMEEQALQNNDLINLLASTNIATLFVDFHFCIRRFTPAATAIFRLLDQDLGRPITDIVSRLNDDTLLDDAKNVLEQRLQREREVRSGDGCWYLRRVQPYLTQDNRIDGVVITWVDITARKQAELNIHYQAHHDALTGLANRREFEYRLARILETAKNNHSEHALMFLDLDQFKIINDSCGHAAGDELLCQLARMLTGLMRERDMLARLGGDEFAVLLEHCTLQRAQQIGETLRKAVETFVFTNENQTFNIGVSIGLVKITATSTSPGEVMKIADAACYAAKESGRNRLHVYREKDGMLVKRQREMRWLTQVRKALTEKRFRLYRQTILALHKDAGDADDAAEELHYELLIRLLDEHGEVVLPKNFLGTVERYGLAAQLDYWVVQTALDWLLSHPQHLQQLTLCTINLSAYTLTDDAFLIFLLEQLQKNPQLPHKLCFEITETAVISNLPHATRFIDEVRQYGCRFALDDFGSGQASFVYLKTLPVDFLKIDGSLVRDIVGDPVDREMIKCIHGMARATGKRTIAEFAESTAILTMLRDIGIDYAQGYAISRPQPLQQPVCAAPGVETLIC